MPEVIIHRGTHTIEGSCVEICSGTHRIIIDLGMPLMERDASKVTFVQKLLKILKIKGIVGSKTT